MEGRRISLALARLMSRLRLLLLLLVSLVVLVLMLPMAPWEVDGRCVTFVIVVGDVDVDVVIVGGAEVGEEVAAGERPLVVLALIMLLALVLPLEGPL